MESLPEYAHTPREIVNLYGELVTVCAVCLPLEHYPCPTQRIHALHAALELRAYFARYGPGGYSHADAIAATVAA